jgi:hypothetical protein
MGRQEDTCWRCGVEWSVASPPPARLAVVQPPPAVAGIAVPVAARVAATG